MAHADAFLERRRALGQDLFDEIGIADPIAAELRGFTRLGDSYEDAAASRLLGITRQ